MHRMRLCFVNGSRAQLTLHELLGFFRHPWAVSSFLIGFLALVVLGPFPDVADLPLAKEIVFWGVLFPSGFAIYLLVTVAAARLWGVAFTLLGHLACAAASGLLAPGFGNWLGTDPAATGPGDEYIVMAFALIFSAGLEFTMATYLLPAYLARIGQRDMPIAAPAFSEPHVAPQPADPTRTNPEVVLLGRSFRAGDLRLVSAEEHYVRIQTEHGKHLLRGRISDIEAQLPEAWGRRVHRSHWVASAAVRALHRGRDSWSVLLCDGQQIPIARARREEVRVWIETLDPSRHSER